METAWQCHDGTALGTAHELIRTQTFVTMPGDCNHDILSMSLSLMSVGHSITSAVAELLKPED